jgi:membrane fusion protein, heavy metal efflux system
MMRRLAQALFAIPIAASVVGCHRHDAPDAHDHGHAAGHDHGEAEELEPIAITRWTDRHELFVEFPPPAPVKPVAFQAHVTRLEGFQAITQGRFRVRFKSGATVAAEGSVEGVKRAGTFTPELTAPAAGAYQLEMIYEHEGKPDVFDCGTVQVGVPPPKEGEPSSVLSFLKEQQWKIPFATAWAKKHPLSRELEVPGTVEPAGGQQLTVGAPTGGRFFHNPKLELAEGRTIKKGDVLGFIVPSVAGDDYGRLQLGVDEGRIDKERAELEIARIEPLVSQGLVPERRLIDLRAQLASSAARLQSAKTRLGRVIAPSGAGGLPIKSTLGGVVTQVLVPNGEPVEGGSALARIGGTGHVWIRARFVAKPPSELQGARPAAVRLPDRRRIELGESRARLLSSQPVVEPASRVATWIVDVAPLASGTASVPEPATDLTVGASVVLQLAIGAPRTVLAVPRAAVVEINTRPFVFVQVDGESFEKRAVQLGAASGDMVEIEQGVSENERIVTRGGFDIHLASLMGSVESHRH